MSGPEHLEKIIDVKLSGPEHLEEIIDAEHLDKSVAEPYLSGPKHLEKVPAENPSEVPADCSVVKTGVYLRTKNKPSHGHCEGAGDGLIESGVYLGCEKKLCSGHLDGEGASLNERDEASLCRAGTRGKDRRRPGEDGRDRKTQGKPSRQGITGTTGVEKMKVVKMNGSGMKKPDGTSDESGDGENLN